MIKVHYRQIRSGMVSFFVFGSLGACERLARRAESQIEGSNGCMREDYVVEHCDCESRASTLCIY